MHQLFAALFAILLSFGHHSAPARSLEASVSFDSGKPTPVLSFPDRHELAHAVSYASYAGSQCSSCRVTNSSYTVR